MIQGIGTKESLKPAGVVAIAILSALFVALVFAVLLQDVFWLDAAEVRLEALGSASVTAGLLFGEMVLAKFR